MLYARRISEDGWFGKSDLDSDSLSELGTTNHQLSVWKIADANNVVDVDRIALALALTKSKIDEFYMVLLNPAEIEVKYRWVVAFVPQEGDTRYKQLKDEHTNFVVETFWEQGYLAEYIHKLLDDEQNYRYYDANTLKKMIYDAVKNGDILWDDIKKDGPWKKAVQEMEQELGPILI